MAAQSRDMLTGVWLGERYLIKELRAHGALCAVYRGEDTVLRRPVAIKVVPEWLSDHYRAALHTTATLVHPVAITPYDAVEQDNTLFLVQEYILAQPLSAYLREGIPIRRALDLTTQIARVLAYAHQRDILHGDLTPAAALIDRRATVRVNNFGLPPDDAYFTQMARLIARWDADTQPAPAALFAAPAEASTAGASVDEQTEQTEQTDEAAAEALAEAPTEVRMAASAITPVAWERGLPMGDVWATGVLLWLMVTTPDDTADAAPNEATQRVFRPEAPEALHTLIERLIVPTHERRIADADTLVSALEELSRNLAQARPQTPVATPPAVLKAREVAAREAERAARLALGGLRASWSPDAPTDPLPIDRFDAGATRAATDFEIVIGNGGTPVAPHAPIGPRLRLPSRPAPDLASGAVISGERPHSASSAPTAPDNPAWAASALPNAPAEFANYAHSDLIDAGDVGAAQPYRPYDPYDPYAAYPAQRAGVLPKPHIWQRWGLGVWLLIGLLLFILCFALGYALPPLTTWLH